MSAPPQPSWNSDIVYDSEQPEAAPPRGQPQRRRPSAAPAEEGVHLFVGQHFHHAKFGGGQLIAWDGSGADLKLHLRFATGIRLILARFCEPV